MNRVPQKLLSRGILAVVLVAMAACRPVSASGRSSVPLVDGLQPFLTAVSGRTSEFEIRGKIEAPIDGRQQVVDINLSRYGEEAFDLSLTHSEYSVSIRRRPNAVAMALPLHRMVFVGRSDASNQIPADSLSPSGISTRLVSEACRFYGAFNLILNSEPSTVAGLLTGVLGFEFDSESRRWRNGSGDSFGFPEVGEMDLRVDDVEVRLAALADSSAASREVEDWPGLRVVRLSRAEVERQLVRGVRRALEVLAPSPLLTTPVQTPSRVEHGQLRWIGGQRVAILEGTPEQIGEAHGQLLKAEAHRCIDSVLFAFGTVQTIRTGRWFRHDLDAAYERLAPHIPERHKRETEAMARAIGIEPQLAQTLNVFPELFHCSGFAVSGKATKDGKLYHGRVLDYMTTIGLQDAATTFIVKPDGKNPFANVGYAGFIGSVSGMNAEAISLGEMGGRGEGKWDGVPMATLMRRALEECSSLDDVIGLWKNNPRTCEYYYVFADGKSNRAVGVAAVPESVEFVMPGQTHPRLGEGITDAVVLSAGSRLEKLRERVQEKYGQIDVEAAKWLMSRPVAMQSNLHNVLFVPEDRVFFVANADHKRPAAERPYVRLDLMELLQAIDNGTPEPDTDTAQN